MSYPWSAGEILRAVDLDAAFAARLSTTGGTISGTLNLTGAGLALDVTNNARIRGVTTFGVAPQNVLTLTPGATTANATTLVTTGAAGIVVAGGPIAANNTNFGRGATFAWSGSAIDTTKLGLYVNNNSSGTSGATEIPVGAYIVGASNNIAAPNALVDQLNVTMNTGGAVAASAGWNAISVNLNDSAATHDLAGSGSGAWVALQVARRASVNQGGSGLTPTLAFGQNWGIDVVSTLQSGATNIGLHNGIEINTAVNTGASVMRRAGLQISAPAAHLVRGAMWDSNICVLLAPGAAKAKNGLVFGQLISGTAPLGTDAKIVSYELSQDWTAVADTGIDFRDVTFTTASIRVPGFSVDWAGITRIGTAFATATTTGLELDVKGSIGTGTPTVNTGGSGFTGTPVADDAYGGVYTLTVTAGAVVSVSVVRQPTYPSASPPATYAVTPRVPSAGTGCVLNGSWDSARTRLALNPAGGAVTMPLLTNAANDAAAAGAGVIVGQLYRNGSVMMQRVA